MTRIPLNREKISDVVPVVSNVLELDNTTAFTPDADYEPATKKYVDDNAGGAPEGTAVLSTGETGGTKFLREDGDGTCSWQDAGDGHTQNTDTGTTNNTFTIDSDSALGKIIIQVVTAAANKTLTIKNQALTDDIIITLPAFTGTLATVAELENYLAKDFTILDGKETPVSDDVLILGDSEDDVLPKQLILGDDRSGLVGYIKSIFDTIYSPL